MSFVSISVFALVVWAVLSTAVSMWSYFLSPLKAFPGPNAARYTNIWRYLGVVRGSFQNTQIRLHRKHGPAVRMGPNTISLSDPVLINKVFSTRSPWKKVRDIQYSPANTIASYDMTIERLLRSEGTDSGWEKRA